MPKVVIEKVAATVPLYEFKKTGGAEKIIAADLDGNGKVDLISYANGQALQNYSRIKGSDDLRNNSLWQETGATITRQELIALREDCGDRHSKIKELSLIGAVDSAIAMGGIMIFVGAGALTVPAASVAMVVAAGVCLASMGVMFALNTMSDQQSKKISDLLQLRTMKTSGAPL
jgi:hypothetical protein